jgi:DNA-binding response OmpR family regulator
VIPAPTSPPSAATDPNAATLSIVDFMGQSCGTSPQRSDNGTSSFCKGRLQANTVPEAMLAEPVSGARVLVVEDEPGIAEPFAAALRREGFSPRLARTAAEARAVLADPAARPDLVVLDLTLPDGDGRDLCRELRRSSDVPIIMLTARGTEADRIVGLELGADDYVVKPFSAGEVAARIRAILRRSAAAAPAAARPVDEERVAVGELEVDLPARRAWLAGEELHLTRKEHDLLVRLLADRGRVVTREELIADVWDTNWFGSTRTLDVHVGLLRRKLHDDPAAPRFLHTVRGVGFRYAANDEVA